MDGIDSFDLIKEYYLNNWFYINHDNKTNFYRPHTITDDNLVGLFLSQNTKDEWAIQKNKFINIQELIKFRCLVEEDLRTFNKNILPLIAKFLLEK